MAKHEKQTIDSSAIIEMEVVDDDDVSDYEVNFSETQAQEDPQGRKRGSGEKAFMDDVKEQMQQNVTSYVWQAGTQQAKKAFNLYANIDILRPYFDVEPHEVRARLIRSLIPSMPGRQREKVHRELYGPTMLVFTMIALLLFQMKTGGHTVQEGTLMGTAFGTCFGYWLGISGFIWFLAYVCNTHITMLQVLSLIGYALFGHCIVLFMTTLIHTAHDHIFFYLMWAIFGGLSTLKLLSVLTSRTTGKTQKIIICAVVALLHLCFLLYLHFAYHQIVEDLSEMIEGNVIPQPQAPEDADHAKKIVERSIDNVASTVRNQMIPEKVPNVPNLKQNIINSAQEIMRNNTLGRNALPRVPIQNNVVEKINATVAAKGSKLLEAIAKKTP